MDISSRVTGERLRLLHRHVPAIVGANVLNGALVAVGLWGRLEERALISWLVTLIALTVFRAGLWFYCRADANHYAKIVRWARIFTVTAAASGLVWGSTAIFFVRFTDPLTVVLIAFVIGGMAAGSVTGLAPHLPAFYLYLATIILPIEARLLVEGSRITLVMAGMGAVYMVSLVLMARNLNASLARQIRLSHENRRLISTMEDEVRQRTADLQAANAALASEIAERKEMERALRDARAEADHANEAKSRFLAAASHDLRQPMQSMFLFVQTLAEYANEARALAALSMLERALETLKSLLDSLLDISRIDVNIIKPDVAVFPVQPILDDVVATYAPIGTTKGLTLRTCGDCTGVNVRSDPTLLGRMVRNLMENAVRYTERGNVTVTHRISGHNLWIEVRDTGIGIPSDQLGQIFEEFHQVDNPHRDKARGLGLGLAIVQRLSRILDHPVEVVSEPGKGSTFAISVPIDSIARREYLAVAEGDYVTL